VIISKLGLISTIFMATYWLNIANILYPSYLAPSINPCQVSGKSFTDPGSRVLPSLQ